MRDGILPSAEGHATVDGNDPTAACVTSELEFGKGLYSFKSLSWTTSARCSRVGVRQTRDGAAGGVSVALCGGRRSSGGRAFVPAVSEFMLEARRVAARSALEEREGKLNSKSPARIRMGP